MADEPEQPLHELLVDDGFYEEVEARLENPNETDCDGKTLLHLAAWSLQENPKIFQLLLDTGADVNALTPSGHTSLHFAVCIKNRRSIAAPIDAGADVNSRDSSGRTPLHFAVLKGLFPGSPSRIRQVGYDEWIVQKLLTHTEINPNLVDEMGETPLIWETGEKNLDALGALLKKGADRRQRPLNPSARFR